MPLDRDAILDAAMRLVSESGTEAFTLRALGDELGVSQMAAYRHFPSKAAIIDELADRVLRELRIQGDELDLPAEERIFRYIRRARHRLLEHPGLVPVIVARPMVSEDRVEDLITLVETFTEAGFGEESVTGAILTLMSVGYGLILFEIQRKAYDRDEGPGYDAMRAQLVGSLLQHPDAPPTSVDLVTRVTNGEWEEAVYEMAMRDVYEGLKARSNVPLPGDG